MNYAHKTMLIMFFCAAPAFVFAQETTIPNRWTTIGVVKSTEYWKSQTVKGMNKDENLSIIMDSFDGTVRICGDMSGACYGIRNGAISKFRKEDLLSVFETYK